MSACAAKKALRLIPSIKVTTIVLTSPPLVFVDLQGTVPTASDSILVEKNLAKEAHPRRERLKRLGKVRTSMAKIMSQK
jgi:precorrin-4 methylase